MSGDVYETVSDELRGFGGFLRCESCGLVDDVNPDFIRLGWPKHCGYTMRWWTRRQVDAGAVPPVGTVPR